MKKILVISFIILFASISFAGDKKITFGKPLASLVLSDLRFGHLAGINGDRILFDKLWEEKRIFEAKNGLIVYFIKKDESKIFSLVRLEGTTTLFWLANNYLKNASPSKK